jgi:hypothetical protein
MNIPSFEFIQASIETDYCAKVFNNIKHDREAVKKCLGEYGHCLKYATQEQKNDQELVTIAVEKDMRNLRFASPALQGNDEFLLKLLKKKPFHLWYIPDLFNRKSFIIKAIRECKRPLTHFDNVFRNDKDIVLEAVKQNGLELQHASKSLRGDSVIALAAVKQYGMALQFVEHDLVITDKRIVLEAVKQNGRVIKQVPESLLQDKAIVRQAYKQLKNIRILTRLLPIQYIRANRDFLISLQL